MYFGKLVELAKGDDLYAHPLHPYTKALLSAIPEPNPITEKNRQRFDYDPKRDHKYPDEEFSLVEVEPEHFVYCTPSELADIKKELGLAE
jgi:oligopeptide transport system ATP-binding protein